MAGQLGRHYSSPERPMRGEVTPPAPGQAYFGYPQPSAAGPGAGSPGAGGFAVPQQQAPATDIQESGWPLAIPAPSTEQRPYRAHSSDSRSKRIWWHLVGYSLVAVSAATLGVVVAQYWHGLL